MSDAGIITVSTIELANRDLRFRARIPRSQIFNVELKPHGLHGGVRVVEVTLFSGACIRVPFRDRGDSDQRVTFIADLLADVDTDVMWSWEKTERGISKQEYAVLNLVTAGPAGRIVERHTDAEIRPLRDDALDGSQYVAMRYTTEWVRAEGKR